MPLGLSKAVFAGTSTIAFAYINAIKLIPYYLLGQINLASLEKVLVLMPVAAVSVFARGAAGEMAAGAAVLSAGDLGAAAGVDQADLGRISGCSGDLKLGQGGGLGCVQRKDQASEAERQGEQGLFHRGLRLGFRGRLRGRCEESVKAARGFFCAAAFLGLPKVAK